MGLGAPIGLGSGGAWGGEAGRWGRRGSGGGGGGVVGCAWLAEEGDRDRTLTVSGAGA